MEEEYGLIGRKLGHSRSPQIWNSLFAGLSDAHTVRRRYTLFPLLDISALPAFLASRPGLRGVNVTIPYKEAILPYLNCLTEEAQAIGAVNTVLIEHYRGGVRLTGHNTDADGFLIALRRGVSRRAIPAKALVLGTGGAAKAVRYALTSIGTDVVMVSRTPSEEGQIGYEELSESVIADRKLIVNATPLGMSPNIDTCPPIPYMHINQEHILFDLVYNPEYTRFMAMGEARGALVVNGLMMLHEQAREAARFFHLKAAFSFLNLP